MRINQNIAAFNAFRNLSHTQNQVSGSLEKLSSGFRINRAADDAAGLVISEGLRAQVGGLKMATRNAQDGVSVVQTAEGALTEVHAMLQRMRDLAVQASNTGANDVTAREALQAEIAELGEEIDRIGETTRFGNVQLFSGVLGEAAGGDGAGAASVSAGTFSDLAFADVAGQAATAADMTGTATLDAAGAPYDLTGANKVEFTVSDGNHSTLITLEGSFADAGEIQTAIDAQLAGSALQTSANTAVVATGSDEIQFTSDGELTISEVSNLATLGFTDGQSDGANATDAEVRGVEFDITVSGPGGVTGQANINLDSDFADVDELRDAVQQAIDDQGVSGVTASVVDDEIVLTHAQDGADYGVEVGNVTVGADNASIVSAATAVGDDGAAGSLTAGEAIDYPLELNAYNSEMTVAVDGVSQTVQLAAQEYSDAEAVRDALNDQLSGATASVDDGRIVITSDTQSASSSVEASGDLARELGLNTEASQTFSFQVGANNGERIQVSVDYLSTGELGIQANTLDVVTSAESAGAAVEAIDGAIANVSELRGTLGASQNRFEHTIANLNVAVENLSASESRIRDADMAEEMVTFTRNQIMQQAGTAMLAQANMVPQSVLSLLG